MTIPRFRMYTNWSSRPSPPMADASRDPEESDFKDIFCRKIFCLRNVFSSGRLPWIETESIEHGAEGIGK